MKPISSLRGIYPDAHAKQIGDLFGRTKPDAATMEALRQRVADLRCFYVICFTNRSGSNFLAQALASDGRLRPALEALNFDTVSKQVQQDRHKTFEAYMAAMIGRHAGAAHVYGVKAGAGQLVMLYNHGILEMAGERLRLIHVKRRSVLEQAVSYGIASRTRRWTSLQEGIEAEVGYEPDELINAAAAIALQNGALGMLFQLLGARVARVEYENLVEHPAAQVEKLGRFLTMPDLRYVAEGVSFQKQADDRNAELLRSLHADFALPDAKPERPPKA